MNQAIKIERGETPDLKAAKERAFEKYMTMATPRFSTVAAVSSVTIEQVKQWHEEDGWLRRRHDLLEEKKKATLSNIGDIKAAAEKAYRSADALIDILDQRVKGGAAEDAKTVAAYAIALEKLLKVRKEALSQLGIRI